MADFGTQARAQLKQVIAVVAPIFLQYASWYLISFIGITVVWIGLLRFNTMSIPSRRTRQSGNRGGSDSSCACFGSNDIHLNR
jgi:hypothetical protein